MKKRVDQSGISHVTPVGGNVFSDLGFSKDEAAEFQKQAREVVDVRLQLRESLAQEIADWIKAEDLRQQDAAIILNVTRPRVSDVVRKKVSKFSLDTLVEMVTRTGKKVELRVKAA